MTEENVVYDLAIIGSGPGGYHAALRAASYGAKVALIEKEERLGGTCSNWGCIPTKALFASAEMIADLKENAEEFGVNVDDFTTDFSKAAERKNKIVKELTSGIESLCNARDVDVFKGFGSLVGGNIYTNFQVKISGEDEKIIDAKRVILATGSKPAQIPSFNIDHERILDSDDILAPDFKELPESMIVIGAGVIGCEFANILAEFGVQVTMLEYLPTILANEERIAVNFVKRKLKKLGVKIHTGKNVLSVENNGDKVVATVCDAKAPKDEVPCQEKQTFDADLCVVSIGRAKVSEGLGLDNFNIETKRGAIQINHETMETTYTGIYSIGDVTGILMLAHFASYQGDVAVSNALSSIGGFDVHPARADFSTVPATTFTNPVIGSVGLRRKEAKEKYGDILVGRFMYRSSGKAKCMGKETGMMMVIADEKSDKIVGATCVGESAAELISEVSVSMRLGLTTEEMAKVIHSHPTLSEICLEAIEDVHGMAIHKAGRRR